MAETIFSEAFSPDPTTGVAAPITEPGLMKIRFVARAIMAPAE